LPLDYLDADVAYLLGLITARGAITVQGGLRTLSIEFPYKNLEAEGVTKKFDKHDSLIAGLAPIRARIAELAESDVDISSGSYAAVLSIRGTKNTVFWRDITMFFGNKTSYAEFDVPDQIFEAESTAQKEFMRGFADVAGTVRKSNAFQDGRHRVYLDVLNQNWTLPVRLCRLLQDELRVPVQTITYGHPNMRDPSKKEYKAGRRDAWAREHQIKIFCEAFIKVGFYIPYKQEILEELAQSNAGLPKPVECTPPKPKRRGKKRHPAESSSKLPPQIRGKHYDAYWEICRDLGCWRYQQLLKQNKKLS